MDTNPFAPDFEDLPQSLPIFPLGGVLLLPCGHLPLNIFELRYRAMVEDAMASDRMIGMVQTCDETVKAVKNDTPVFKTGCAGKITEFSETPDGCYLITLTGVCRFDIEKDMVTGRGYRRVKPGWNSYGDDLKEQTCLDLDRARMKELLREYFDKEGMDCDWEAIDEAPDGKLITCLSMVCPFEAQEKQALLEAECCQVRAKMFMTMLEMAVCASSEGCASRH